MNPYHRFLIKHRPFCELCSAPMPATAVVEIHNKRNQKRRATVVCDAHYRAHTPIETGLKLAAKLENKSK